MQSYVICGYVKGTEEEMAREISRIRPIIKNVYSRRNRIERGTRGRETKCGEWQFVGLFCQLSRWRDCQLSQEILHVFFGTEYVSLVHADTEYQYNYLYSIFFFNLCFFCSLCLARLVRSVTVTVHNYQMQHEGNIKLTCA